MIIGLTGKNCAGKGTVAEYLKEKGFYYYSLSDAIREEAREKGIENTRENLIKLGNELRESFGSAVLAERICRKLHNNKNYVIDSIRNPFEAKEVKKQKNSHLFLIEAPLETRYKRSLKRRREGEEKITLKKFKELEEVELRSGNQAHQQLEETESLADHIVLNDSSIDELKKRIDETIQKLDFNFERPSWDEYFMRVAYEVATRSNCVKRKVAAVIAKDKRIISTGYNGTPRGTVNCSEGGCPRCNSFGQSGANLGECFCSHGEENAIVQASYHGVAISCSTLYTTFSPCLLCTKMIINSGITRVVYNEEYPLAETPKKLLKDSGVEVVKMKI